MVEPKQILKFAILAAIMVAVFLVPYEPFERAYAAAFRGANNVVFSRFWVWGDGKVSFVDLRRDGVVDRINGASGLTMPQGFRPPQSTGSLDTLMLLQNKTVPRSLGMVRTSSRAMGWWPTAITVAFMLASPGSWRRRLIGLVWGVVLVHAFIALRVTIEIAYMGFARSEKAYSLFSLSETSLGLLARIEEVFVQDPTISFVAPVFIWLVISLLNGSLSTFRPGQESVEHRAGQPKKETK